MVAERRFYIGPAAAAEIAGAIAWYGSRHPGLEVAFVEDVDRVFTEIREAPKRWPLWGATVMEAARNAPFGSDR